MNYIAIIAALSATLAAGGGGFIYGQYIGRIKCELAQEKIENVIEESAKKSREAASEAIAGIKITNRTINQKVINEITEVPVYSSCIVPASGVRAANQAIAGQVANSGKLPEAGGDSAGQ